MRKPWYKMKMDDRYLITSQRSSPSIKRDGLIYHLKMILIFLMETRNIVEKLPTSVNVAKSVPYFDINKDVYNLQ